MAKVKCKGTLLQQEIGNAYTTVAQVTDLSTDGLESESVETDSLDNTSVGIPSTPTGRVKPGSAAFDIMYDPTLAGHKAILSALTAATTENWKHITADGANTAWSYMSAGISFGHTFKQGDVVRGSVKLTLADVPTLPT
jgi:hypothetical protein